MKNLLLIVVALSYFTIYSQERVLNFPAGLSESAVAYSVVDKESGNLAIFLREDKKIYGILYNENYEELGEAELSEVPLRFEELTGYQIDGRKIKLYLNNSDGRRFAKLAFDFKEGLGSFDRLDLRLRREEFIQSFSYPDNFLILSVSKRSNLIKIYEFKQDDSPVVHEIDFKDTKFLNKDNFPSELHELFVPTREWAATGKIREGIPVSIEMASKKVKAYKGEKEVLISLDNNNYITYLLKLDLENFNGSVVQIKKPELNDKKDNSNSNSFLLNDKLYQIVANKDAFQFQVFDLVNEEVLKSYNAHKDEEIHFINTPMLQQGRTSSSNKEYDKSGEFIRKISNSAIAISVAERGSKYHISFGSSLEIEQASIDTDFVMLYGMMNGFGSTFNTTFSAYMSYAFARTVRATGLFDENFNHLEGEVEANVFDRIKTFAGEYDDISAETVFKKNKQFHWGYYDIKENTYNILKFD